MEVIGNTLQTPAAFTTIDDVTCALRRISGLCHVLTHIGESASTVNAEQLVYTLSFILDGIDAQIELLDGIQWTQQKAVGA